MKTQIFILLKNEGVPVYRSVEATKINDDIYQICGVDSYDPEDEEWEFVPGQTVFVQEKKIDGDFVLVAVSIA